MRKVGVNCLNFTDKEDETGGGDQMTWPRSYSQEGVEARYQGWRPGFPDCRTETTLQDNPETPLSLHWC